MIRFYDSMAVLDVHGKAIVDPPRLELLRQKYDLFISNKGVKDISRQRFITNKFSKFIEVIETMFNCPNCNLIALNPDNEILILYR